MKTTFHLLAFIAVYGFASALCADTIYTYEGPELTQNAPYCNDNGCNLEITLDLSAPLGDNYMQTVVAPVSWTITDGDFTMSNNTPGLTDSFFDFITNGSGTITGWSILQSTQGTGNILKADNTGPTFFSVYNDQYFTFGGDITNEDFAIEAPGNPGGFIDTASGQGSPANWSVSSQVISSVPEPVAASWTGLLMAALIAFERWQVRRRRKALLTATPEETDDDEKEETPLAHVGPVPEGIITEAYLADTGWVCPDGRLFYAPWDQFDGWSRRDAIAIQQNIDRHIAQGFMHLQEPDLRALAVALNRIPAPDAKPPLPPTPPAREAIAA
jgi:hypothetical protein